MSEDEKEQVARIMRLMSSAVEQAWKRREAPCVMSMGEALGIADGLGLKVPDRRQLLARLGLDVLYTFLMPGDATRSSKQRVVTLALAVLNQAAYLSRTQAVDTEEVRLALAALWCILKDRRALIEFYETSRAPSKHPWQTCRWPYYGIAAALRDEGWDAPVQLRAGLDTGQTHIGYSRTGGASRSVPPQLCAPIAESPESVQRAGMEDASWKWYGEHHEQRR